MRDRTALFIPVEDVPTHILERQMGSVLHQVLRPDDIIIVDNHSEGIDNTAYLEQLEGCEVYFLDEKLDSMGKILNYALTKTDAELITGIHVGDFIHQRFIEVFSGVLDKIPNTMGVRSWTNIYIENIFLTATDANSVPMLRRSAVESAGRFAEDLDMAWNDIMYAIGPKNISRVQHPLYNSVYWHGAKYKDDNMVKTLIKYKIKEGERLDLLFPEIELRPWYRLCEGKPFVKDPRGGTLVVLEPALCMRALKETMAVRGHFDNVYAVTITPYLSANTLPMQRQLFDAVYYTDTKDDFQDLLRKLKPKVIHSHNSPDALAVWANEIKAELGCGVIHDVHDVGSITFSNYCVEDEKLAMEGSDAIICVSEAQLRYLEEKYELPDRTEIVRSYMNERYIPRTPSGLENPPHIVYSGHLTTNHYRDIYDMIIEIIRQGIHLSAHTVQSTSLGKYENIRNGHFHLYDTMSCEDFWAVLPRYDVGLLAFNKNFIDHRKVKDSSIFEHSLPNKLLEYLAFGIVPMVIGPIKPSAEFVTEHGIGLAFDTVPRINDIMDDIAACKKQLDRVHRNFTMESQAEKILELYAMRKS